MKNDRQTAILDIISAETIETQDQLLDRLSKRGFSATQATVSRDIKQLDLIKEPIGGGRLRYTVSAHKIKLNIAGRLRLILRESIVGVDYAQNIVVLRTMPGLAGAAGAAFDSMEIPTMLGSIAGDDTVMMVMRTTTDAADLCAEIAEMRK